MKAFWMACAALVTAFPAIAQPVAPAPSAPDAISARLKAESAAGRFSGFALITRDDAVIYAGGTGAISPDGATATAKTPWRIASITKQITAVLVMQEVERGRLSLDDTLGTRLPAFAGHPAASVTVRQLLQHTSGLANPSDSVPGDDGFPVFYKAAKADHVYCAGPPRAAPGDFNYNNCDYYLLADILEAETGQAYADLIEARLAKPLGLTSLHLYAPDEAEAFVARDTTGAAEPAFQMSSYEAAAGLSLSADDLRTFDSALMGGRLLSADSLKTLWTGEPSLGYVALGAWAYTVQPSGCAQPMDLVERRGGVGNVATLNLMWPARKASIIVFSNTDTDWGQLWQDSGLMRDLAVAAWCE